MSTPERKKVSAIDFFCLGFGAIVGVGWAVSINGWMTNCGGPVPAGIGYLLCLIIMVPVALCYCELVPMMPVAGGGMAFAFRAFNEKVATISGWAAFGAFVFIIPWEAIQITDVLGYLIPALKAGNPLYTVLGSDVYLSTIIIGVVCSVAIFAINMRGLASAALLQKILCFFLIGCAIVGAIAALVGGTPGNLTPIYDVSDPTIYGPTADGLKEVSHSSMFGGCFAIVSQAAFFLSGFETIPQGVEDAGGDLKGVGKTVVLSVSMACIFYAILLFCFGYGYQWQAFAHLARPAAATMFPLIFPGTTGTVLFWILTIGAVAGLLTTWNGFFTASANLLMAMARGRLIPKVFAKQNANGVAVNGQLVCFLLSLAGPFVGANMIDPLTTFSAAAFMLSWCLTAWSLVLLRKNHPEMERPYKIPGGMATGLFAAILMTVVLVCAFIPVSPFYVGDMAVKMFIIWMAIGVIFFLVSGGQRKGLSEAELEEGVFGKKDA